MKGCSRRKTAALICAALLLAAGCASPAARAAASGSAAGASGGFSPTFYENSFSAPVPLCDGVQADLTTADEGYVGLSAVREKTVKAQLCLGEDTYTYTVPHDGTTTYLPLQLGSGVYRLRVLENTVDDRYVELCATEVAAELRDEFQPFLHANALVNYQRESACVAKAAAFAAESADEADFMARIYKFIRDSIRYDDALAATVKAGYTPEPDRTLSSGKGICFDYAALAAAMLRSQGLPAKVITGYVGEEALYHAWNAVYLQESGWITVELRIDSGDWTRIDLTFAAAGENESIYVDRFVY